jgi:hypothetical protein
LQHGLSSRVARGLNFETCYKIWKWSPAMPEFQWEMREHKVTQEKMLQNFQMPDFSAQTRRHTFAQKNSRSYF